MHGRVDHGERDGGDAAGLGPVALDANALDRDGSERDALVEAFLTVLAAGELMMVVSPGVRAELAYPNTPPALRAALLVQPAPPARTLGHEQKLDRIRVRAILRGEGPADRHEADALNLSEAAEAGCAVFITHDRRILRRRADLRSVLPALRIMTLAAFMAAVAPDAEPPPQA